MKRTALLLIGLAALVPVQSLSAAAEESTTLVGHFESGFQDGPERLEAVFTATGSGVYDVDFHFKFNGARHTYSGTAEGSLSDGELRGEVKNESRNRTFTFDGDFEDGVFRGMHAEVRRGRESKTGSMTLR